MPESYSVRAVLEAYDSGFTSGMEKAAKATQNLGGSTQTNMKTVGKAVTVAGAATTAMGVSALKSYGSFQQSLNQAAVIAGGTSKDIKGLSDVANKMGADLPISAQNAADAMVAMARDGASISTIKKEFPAIAKAATAAGADLQTTASVVQQSMNIWGDSLQSPEQAAGILVSTANMSNASIESMQQALATIGPAAKMTGMDMQTASTAIGLLTNKGFSAAQASDDLNHAILQMAAPSKVAQSAMTDLGISYRDAQGNMKPFPQILSEVAQKTDGLSKSQKDAALKALFGTAGMKAMLPLLDSIKDKSGNTSTSWDAFSKAMDKAAGSTDKATKTLDNQAKEMQKNVGSKIEQVGGNWESLRNKAMDSQSRVTGALLDITNSTLSWAGESDSAFAKATRGFIGLTPVIGPAMTAVGGFLTNAQKISGVLTSVGKKTVDLAGKFLPIGNNAKKASDGLNQVDQGAQKAGNSSRMSAKNMTALGAAAMQIGVGIGIASAGLATLVYATAQLADRGWAGAGAMLAVSAAIGALGIGLALGIKYLTTMNGSAAANAKTMLALGTMMLEAGIGIGVATAGIGLLVLAIAKLADTGTAGVVALGAFTVAVAALAGIFALLGPALTASSVGIGVFAAAVLAVGAGIGLATAGIAALITALNNFNMSGAQVVSVLGSIGAGFAMMITNFVLTLATQMPKIALAFVQMFITIQQTIIAHLPQMISNGIQMLVMLVQGITQGLPQIVTAVTQMIVTFLTNLTANLPQILAAGIQLMVAFLDGLAQGMPPIIEKMVDLLVQMILAIGENAPRLVAAFGAMIGDLLKSMIEITPLIIQVFGATLLAMIVAGATYASKFSELGGILLKALKAGFLGQKYDAVGAAADVIKSAGSEASKNGMAAFDKAGGNSAISSLKAISAKKGDHQTAGSSLGSAAANGINSKSGEAKNAGNSVGSSAASGIQSKNSDTRNAGSSLGSSAASGVRSKHGEMHSAGGFIGSGLVAGIQGMTGNVLGAAATLASKAAGMIRRALKIHSPSRVTKELGMYFGLGFVNGINGMEEKTGKAAQSLAEASMFSVPSVDTHDFTNSIAAMNSNMSSSVTGGLTHELNINQQPAYINLSLGGSDYGAFVEDIGREQGTQASLMRNYKF